MIKEWIKAGDIPKVLEELNFALENITTLNKELTMFQARFHTLEEKISLATIGNDYADLQRRQILASLMELEAKLTQEIKRLYPEPLQKRSLTTFQDDVQNKLEKNYEILFDIAVGNTAVVYKAKNKFSGRFAAIRALKKQDLTQEPSYQKSKKEMLDDQEATQKMFQFRHRHVIQVLGAYLDTFPSCMVTDYISGATSFDKILPVGPRPLSEALTTFAKIGGALHYIHTKGLVHGKVKPAKILIDLEGEPMISPIELFSTSPAYYDLETLEEDIQYASPEILANEKQGPLSDQFSLGLIGYEMLAGTPVFKGKNIVEIFHSRDRFFFDDTYRARLFRNLEAPRKIQRILERMLKAEKTERFPTIKEALQEMAQVKIKVPEDIQTVRLSYSRACSRDDRLIRSFLHFLFQKYPAYREFFPVAVVEEKKRQRLIRHAIPLLFSEKGEFLPLKGFFSTSTPIQLTAVHYREMFQTLMEFLQLPENDYLWDESIAAAWQSLAQKVIERIEAREEGEA